MTLKDALREGYSVLFYAEVETPMLDATVLLCDAAGISKEELFASLPEYLDRETYDRYKLFLEQRCSGIPVSYIRHKKEFYGIEFYVDERVLVPRPDTEVLVEEALSIIGSKIGGNRLRMLDLCTGSGCIAISIAKNAYNVEVNGSDISKDARAVFDFNSLKILGRKLPFYLSDLFDTINGSFDLITCNPPYLVNSEVEKLIKLGWREPQLALAGGNDGTKVAVRVIREAFNYLNKGGYLLIEAAPDQMTKLYAIMDSSGYRNIYTRKDLGNRERIICGRKQ